MVRANPGAAYDYTELAKLATEARKTAAAKP
jgi:hypothetical protein